MKIALVGPIDSPVMQDAKGGSEIWTYNLAESLVKRGFRVDLYAAAGSQSTANIITSVDQKQIIDSHGEISPKKFAYYSLDQMVEVVKRQSEYDIIHLSVFTLTYYLPLLKLIHVPVVITVHGNIFSARDNIDLKGYPNSVFVFASEYSRESWPEAMSSEVIHHGINMIDYPLGTGSGGYYFWMSRIYEGKGLPDAISFAEKTNSELIIAGPYNDQKYFDLEVAPRLSDKIKYVGSLGLRDKVAYYQNAKAFLFTIHNPEPFGLVNIEAMACGTPVLSYKLGGMQEIVKDGVSGYLVAPGDVDSMVKIASSLESIDRQKCKEDANQRFSLDGMVEQYLSLYSSLKK